MKMLTIGLTGPTGAGKSSLRPVFERMGCEVLDSDIYARRVTAPGSPALLELADEFGHDIIRGDGALDRALLASRAFATAESCARLNGITHPRITEMLLEDAHKAHENGSHAVIDAPLLFEAGIERVCDCVLAVIAPVEIRISRIMLRDAISREAAELRISAQHDNDYYCERSQYVIINDSTNTELCRRAEKITGTMLRERQ